MKVPLSVPPLRAWGTRAFPGPLCTLRTCWEETTLQKVHQNLSLNKISITFFNWLGPGLLWPQERYWLVNSRAPCGHTGPTLAGYRTVTGCEWWLGGTSQAAQPPRWCSCCPWRSSPRTEPRVPASGIWVRVYIRIPHGMLAIRVQKSNCPSSATTAHLLTFISLDVRLWASKWFNWCFGCSVMELWSQFPSKVQVLRHYSSQSSTWKLLLHESSQPHNSLGVMC